MDQKKKKQKSPNFFLLFIVLKPTNSFIANYKFSLDHRLSVTSMSNEAEVTCDRKFEKRNPKISMSYELVDKQNELIQNKESIHFRITL